MLLLHIFFSRYRTFFSISYKPILLVETSSAFVYLKKTLSLHHFWSIVLPNIVFLVGNIFLFTLRIYNFILFCHGRYLLRNLFIILWGFLVFDKPQMPSFKTLCLLAFDNSIIIYLGVNFFRLLLWEFIGLLKYGCSLSSQVWKVFGHYFFLNKLCVLLFIYCLSRTIMCILVWLMVSYKCHWFPSFFFSFFSLFVPLISNE